MSRTWLYIIYSILLLTSSSGFCQSPLLIKTISLTGSVHAVSIDRTSNFYVANKQGGVYKYNPAGDWLVTYSPDRVGNIKSIEAWSAMNILLFYEGLQEYRFLNRFLIHTTTNRLEQQVFARLMTPSADNNLWLIDDTDYSLKKLNILYNTPEITSPLNSVIGTDFDGRHMREYQNMLFVSDYSTGIYVFDNLGNYIRTLPLPQINYFSFLENELYYLSNGAIHFYNIYTADVRTIPIPKGEKYLYALVSPQQLYLFSQNIVDIYSIGN